MRKIFTSIDIGTDSIKIATIEYYNSSYNVLAAVSVKSSGVKQGLIVNATDVSNAIKKGVKMIESRLGTKVDKVLAIVPSHNATFDMVTGEVKVDNEENKVTGDVIFSCMQNSIKKSLQATREVVTVFPVEYKLDKNAKIDNPLGMTGKNLSLKAVVSSVPKKNVYSVVSIIENLDIEVIDILYSTTANYYAIKTKDLDNKVIAMVDIGEDITKVGILNKGVLIKESLLPIGSKNIDNDIASKYKLANKEEAKEIKEKFAVSNRKYADTDEIMQCTNKTGEVIEIDQYRLSEIIESRVVDILKNVKNELNNLTNREIGYIIITGGMTGQLGFNAIVEELFVRNSSVMNLGVIGIRDNKYSSCLGIVKYFIEKLELREKEYTMFSEEKIEEMLSTRKKVGAAGVLSKIFEKIFD